MRGHGSGNGNGNGNGNRNGSRSEGDGDGGRVRCWLVERSYDDRDIVTLVYATGDGRRYNRRELSATALSRAAVTAAREVDPEDLRPVEDDDRRERYAAEAARMAADHDPGDPV
jgi:hypothetical protein